MSAPWAVVAASLGFASGAACALRLSDRICRNVLPFSDGPLPARPPNAVLCTGAAAVGMSLATQGTNSGSLALDALLTAALAGAWHSDVYRGIVPDIFTLVPLCAVLSIALVAGNPWPACSALVGFVPFAIAALASRGVGMGWGDAKLVALGAAALGAAAALPWFAAACLLAVLVAAVRGRRCQPIAFAPYLAGSIALALAVPPM